MWKSKDIHVNLFPPQELEVEFYYTFEGVYFSDDYGQVGVF
jgi:hypothetical protein